MKYPRNNCASCKKVLVITEEYVMQKDELLSSQFLKHSFLGEMASLCYVKIVKSGSPGTVGGYLIR